MRIGIWVVEVNDKFKVFDTMAEANAFLQTLNDERREYAKAWNALTEETLK